MRAVRMHGYGHPEVLAVDEVAEPGPPRGDEVLVRTSAASINGTDLGLRRGSMKIATWGRLPFTLGFDLAGEVVACGPRVTAFAPGDRVAALLGHAGGAQCDLVRLRQHRAARVPHDVPNVAAAAMPLAGLTALQALHRVGALTGRQPATTRVLVIGASGGIGAYAVQLATLSGAQVTGMASGDKLDQVRAWGASTVIDRHHTHTKDLVGLGERFDLVLDAHGGSGYADLRGLLRDGGGVVSTRPVSRDSWRTLAGAVPSRRRNPVPYGAVATKPCSADLSRLLELLRRGLLDAAIDSVFPVTDVRQAHDRAGTTAAGKVVLQF